jgi:hypothetical protein
MTSMSPPMLPFCALALSCSLAGCAFDADQTGAESAVETEPTGSGEEAITGGAPVGAGPGTVQIEYVIPGVGTSWCSGVVIGPNVALTAGHCFDAGLTRAGTHGWVNVKIHATTNGSNWRCMTRNSMDANGRCLVYDNVWVNRLAASPPREHVDATLDFAVLTTQFPFINLTGFPNVWVQQRVDDSVRMFGVGQEGTTMRFFDDRLDYVGSNHMVIDAGTRRVCGGDSGGPLIMNKYDQQWLMGLHVNSEGQFDQACVAVGKKQRSHRITRARIDWINLATEWVRPYGQPLCTLNAILNDRDAGFRCF